MGRVKKSDAREMQSFYQHYYKKYIQALQNAADKADRWVQEIICLLDGVSGKVTYICLMLIFLLNTVHNLPRHIRLPMFSLRF